MLFNIWQRLLFSVVQCVFPVKILINHHTKKMYVYFATPAMDGAEKQVVKVNVTGFPMKISRRGEKRLR